MFAHVGDWLIVESRNEHRHARRGEIVAVHGDNGAPPYTVHWMDGDHEALVFPGPDGQIMTAEQLAERDRIQAQRIDEIQGSLRSHST